MQDLFHQQHVESTLSHHLPVLYSSLPENKQPTGVSLPGSLGIIICLLFEDAWSSGYNRKKSSAACTNRGNPHFRMICQFMDRRSMFQAGFCWGVPLGFQCLSVLWTRNSWRNKRSCRKDSRSLVGDVLRCQKQVAKHLMTAPKMRPKYQIGWNGGNISVISTVCTSQINLTIQFRTGRWLWLLGIGFLHRFWDSSVESWRAFNQSQIHNLLVNPVAFPLVKYLLSTWNLQKKKITEILTMSVSKLIKVPPCPPKIPRNDDF